MAEGPFELKFLKAENQDLKKEAKIIKDKVLTRENDTYMNITSLVTQSINYTMNLARASPFLVTYFILCFPLNVSYSTLNSNASGLYLF